MIRTPMAATATLANKTVKVTPGGEAISEVRVRNSGTVVDQFTLEVLGDPAAWAIVEPAVVPLFPGAEATARIRFKPPKSSSVLARAVPFAVRIKSREDARASLVEEGVVEVGPFNDTFAELIPRTAKGRSRARAQLALDNRGNVRVNARLTAADPDRKLNFAITPQALSAEPGTASFASIRLSPRQRFLTGPQKMNPYKVMIHQDGLPTITVDGSMQQEGLIPGWVIPAAIAALALLLVLAILWFTLLKPAIQSTAQEAAQNSTAVQAAQSQAAKALVAASAAAAGKPVPSGAGLASGPNPINADQWSARMSLNGKQGQQASAFLHLNPDGGVSVTDLIFENPNGDSGTIAFMRGGEVLLTMRLENFRDLDFHYISPLIFQGANKTSGQDQTITLTCTPDSSSSCTSAVQLSGYATKPNPSP
jgi:hypothetical protein